MPPQRTTTEQDVALAEVERKARRDLVVAYGFVAVAVVAASWLPITALEGVVEPLAGETTSVDVNVIVSVAISLSLVVNVLQYVKGRSQRRELKRLRERADRLEQEDRP